MELQLIRNATMRLFYKEKMLLLDPCFAKKGTGPSYAGNIHSPIVDLPCKMWQAESGADAYIVSHIHSDHFDEAARSFINKDRPLYCQPCEADAPEFKEFEDVRPFDTDFIGEMAIQRVPAIHGSGQALKDMGEASGVVFMAGGEPNLYWAGDTILCDEVKETIKMYQPGVIIVHAGGAMWNGELIIMDAAQVIEVCKLAPYAKVIAVHMESCDHCTVSRAALRAEASKAGINPEQLIIPADGETIKFD